MIAEWGGASPELILESERRFGAAHVRLCGIHRRRGWHGGLEVLCQKPKFGPTGKAPAVVNLDTLGLAPSEVWTSHSDKQLVNDLFGVAQYLKVPLSAVNVDAVGTTDSESFVPLKVPRIRDSLPDPKNPECPSLEQRQHERDCDGGLLRQLPPAGGISGVSGWQGEQVRRPISQQIRTTRMIPPSVPKEGCGLSRKQRLIP